MSESRPDGGIIQAGDSHANQVSDTCTARLATEAWTSMLEFSNPKHNPVFQAESAFNNKLCGDGKFPKADQIMDVATVAALNRKGASSEAQDIALSNLEKGKLMTGIRLQDRRSA